MKTIHSRMHIVLFISTFIIVYMSNASVDFLLCFSCFLFNCFVLLFYALTTIIVSKSSVITKDERGEQTRAAAVTIKLSVNVAIYSIIVSLLSFTLDFEHLKQVFNLPNVISLPSIMIALLVSLFNMTILNLLLIANVFETVILTAAIDGRAALNTGKIHDGK